jgi:hypothetical protein
MADAPFDRFTRALRPKPSRRAALRTTLAGAAAAAGWLTATAPSPATPKRGKRKCPVCPPPPPAPFCAGKNSCASEQDVTCSRPVLPGEPGVALCGCYIRADTAESFCATLSGTVTHCADCPPGRICVVLGGLCGGGFSCAFPCQSPR